MLKTIFFFLFISIVFCVDFTFLIVADTHIGAQNSIQNSREVVKKINNFVSKERVLFTFIDGDVTNVSILTTKLSEVKWYPIMGNHDIWQYNSTWEEKEPTGDHVFGETFKKQFENVPGLTWNNKPSYNPDNKITSWFQNYEIRVGDVVFFCLDFVSRYPAVRSLGYKGAMPTAMLHDFPDGTVRWLESRLKLLRSYNPSQVIFIQHHPFRGPNFVPTVIYGFSGEKKKTLRDLYEKYYDVSKYYGMFGGHWHRWFDGTAFDEWKNFKQWETDATKERPSVTVVRVKNSKISSVEKL